MFTLSYKTKSGTNKGKLAHVRIVYKASEGEYLFGKISHPDLQTCIEACKKSLQLKTACPGSRFEQFGSQLEEIIEKLNNSTNEDRFENYHKESQNLVASFQKQDT